MLPSKSRTTNLGPFGEVIRATSSITPAIPIRWSTKYTDLETDLVYYGYRYYSPSTGRWLSRDPIGEKGGLNLYGYLGNSPTGSIDPLGQELSQLDQANQQFNEAFWAWVGGEGGSRSYGPNDPWTKELAKKPVYDRMRTWIANEAKEMCKIGRPKLLVNRTFPWNDRADDHPFIGPLIDAFNMVFETGLQSTGSTEGKFTITSLSCCPSQVCFDMKVTDELRLGSATRIPLTSWSLLPDVPHGPVDVPIPGSNFSITWQWSECIKFAF